MRDLIARAGPQTIGWDRRQLRIDECPVGIDQVVMIVEITPVNAVLVAQTIIQTKVVFAIVEGIGLLESGVVARGGVRVGHGQFLHGGIYRADRNAIRRHANGLPVEPQVRKVATGNWLPRRYRSTRCRIDRRITRGHIKRPATPAEVSSSFCPGWHRAPHRRRVQSDVLPLFTSKKEKLVFLDGPVEVPAEIVKAEFPFYGGKEGARIQLVVAEKFEGAAMITIAAAARDDVNRSAGIASVFGREICGLNLDFLNEVNADVVDLAVVTARIHIESAIDRKTVVVGAVSIDSRLTDT